MDPDTILHDARSAMAATRARTVDLLRSLPDAEACIPGAAWTVREAAVHLVNFAYVNGDVAAGISSPRMDLSPEGVARDNDRRIADISEADPGKLAALVRDAADRFLDVTADRPGDQQVTFHGGFPIDLAGLAGIELAEFVLHGYDMATAVGSPWPIDPAHAALILYGYGACFGLLVDRERARGVTAGFGIELRGADPFTIRFVDGEYRLEPDGSGPVDCRISTDPLTFLMVGTGRLSRWAAVALGLISAGGDRPELALGFTDLFAYP